jgi:DNA-binding winged helix-turn-helix (wHTH) protein
MQMTRLRESLAAVGLDALVETVRGKGYRLAAAAEVRA